MIMSSAAKTLESLTTDCLILFANYRKREADYTRSRFRLPIANWRMPIDRFTDQFPESGGEFNET